VARAIIEDRPDPVAQLAAGVILQPGEDAWARVRARLAVRTSQAAWTANTRVSWLGRRARSVTCETSTYHWQDHGEIDWLITSERVVGRLPASSEMISLWWSGLAGVDIDLKRDRIVVNGVKGWTGKLTGPAVAPIAVTAVAKCHGLEAVWLAPALAALRLDIPDHSGLRRAPRSVNTVGEIIRFPIRRDAR
jgi:hypothetical protein